MGATPGTVLVTGPTAFHLFRRPIEVDIVRAPALVDRVAVMRPFVLAVRDPAAVRGHPLTSIHR